MTTEAQQLKVLFIALVDGFDVLMLMAGKTR